MIYKRAIALLCLAFSCAAQNRLTPSEKAAGWKLLFDGKTSAGWLEVTGLPFPDNWAVKDGCIKTVPAPDCNQDIRTAETYRNFEFQFEWKIAKGGNSGVKYLVQKTDRWQRKGEKGFQARARGLEYQLLDDAEAEESRVDATKGTASLYGLLAPTPRLVAEPEKWHQSRILVKGDHAEHWYDGKRVLSFDVTEPKLGVVKRDTMISLQNHKTEVWFRNLKIRRLD